MYKSSSIVFFKSDGAVYLEDEASLEISPLKHGSSANRVFVTRNGINQGRFFPPDTKGRGERRLFFLFLSFISFREFRLTPLTAHNPVRTVSVSCVGRLACFNHRPPRPLRPPPRSFFFLFFPSRIFSPLLNVGLMEVISMFPMKLARILYINVTSYYRKESQSLICVKKNFGSNLIQFLRNDFKN